MKILWVNPSFLDYRVPVYRRLNELSDGNFHIVFSRRRVPERVVGKISRAIGSNAIVLDGETIIGTRNTSGFSNRDIHIPLTRGLYKAIRGVGADIVIGEGFFQWTPMALRYCLLHRRPLVIAYERTKHTERACPRWRTAWRKMVGRAAAGYLCNGQLTREYISDVIGAAPEKIFTGGMSADSEGLVAAVKTMPAAEREALRRTLMPDDKDTGLLYVFTGQLVERKGVAQLLSAWQRHVRQYPDDGLAIVGDGPLRDSLTTEFGRTTGVTFTGAVDYDSIYRYYAAADVFVIPTLEDNWSLVVPEAMACQLPVMCSIYNGCWPELCRDGENGVTFDPLDEDSTVRGLATFHNADLAAWGRRSVEIEHGYNTEAVAQNIYSALTTILQRQ